MTSSRPDEPGLGPLLRWLEVAAPGFRDGVTKIYIRLAREAWVRGLDADGDERRQLRSDGAELMTMAALRVLRVTGLPTSQAVDVLGFVQDEVVQAHRLLDPGTRAYERSRLIRRALGFEPRPGQPSWRGHPDDVAAHAIEEIGWDAFWGMPVPDRMRLLVNAGYPGSRPRDAADQSDPELRYRREEKRLRELKTRLERREDSPGGS